MMKESNESERTHEEPLNTENDIANVPSILEKYTFTLLKDVFTVCILFLKLHLSITILSCWKSFSLSSLHFHRF